MPQSLVCSACKTSTCSGLNDFEATCPTTCAAVSPDHREVAAVAPRKRLAAVAVEDVRGSYACRTCGACRVRGGAAGSRRRRRRTRWRRRWRRGGGGGGGEAAEEAAAAAVEVEVQEEGRPHRGSPGS